MLEDIVTYFELILSLVACSCPNINADGTEHKLSEGQ